MSWSGRLGWGVAGLAAVGLHAALLVVSKAPVHGDVSLPAGPSVESAASLAGIVGQVVEHKPVEPRELDEIEPTKARPIEPDVAVQPREIIGRTVSPSQSHSEMAEVISDAQVQSVEAVTAMQIVVPETSVAEPLIPQLAEPTTPDEEINELTSPKPRKVTRKKSSKTIEVARGRAKPKRQRKVRNRTKRQRRQKERKIAQRRATKSARRGNSAKGSAGAKAGGRRGRSTASSGAINAYASRVRARILSRSPSGGGKRGTAVVSFGLRSNGSLRFARISRSSGNRSLDVRALAAVRGGGFPRPPSGATARQLRFTIPFHFR